MGKNKYNAPSSAISEYIYNDYLCDSDLNKEDIIKEENMQILLNNGLACKISGTDFLVARNENTYRVACKFMQKYNKLNKKYRRRISDYEYGGKYADSIDNLEIAKLVNSTLNEGTYYCQMDDENYAKLLVKFTDIDGCSCVRYEFYLIGKEWKKWEAIFYNMIDKYSSMITNMKNEYIYYSDGRPSAKTIFKSFDQVILKDKENLLKYIDNWVSNIPIYHDKYKMISKLSIMLYGEPGTGKSTVAKAIAKYLNISNVTSLGPDYFSSNGKNNGRRRVDGDATIYTIDDIDCICNSRSENNDKENNEILASLLSFLDNPSTFYYKTKNGLSYPISIVIATTNYYDKLDPAVKRYGRFDLKIEMKNFDKDQAEEMCKLYDLKLSDLIENTDDDDFNISPSYLQVKCLENVDKSLKTI